MQINSLRRIQPFCAAHLTRRLAVLILPTLLAVTGFAAFGTHSFAQQERKLTIRETTWPKGVLELVEVKNLQAEDFPKGFGLGVKNVSNKPIYYLSIKVHFLDTGPFTGNGKFAVSTLYCGNPRLSPADSRAEPGDTALMPGETCTLGNDDEHVSLFFHWLDPDRKRELRENALWNIGLNAQKVSFGDGTGYLAGSYYPVRRSTN